MTKVGIPLQTSARLSGVSQQHLRRHIKENAGAVRVGRRWVFNDLRARRFPVYSGNELKTLVLSPYEASRASQFMHAVRQFLPIGDISLRHTAGKVSPTCRDGFTRSRSTPIGCTSWTLWAN
jgi:hypothetical protein